jgi:hypothetical protein
LEDKRRRSYILAPKIYKREEKKHQDHSGQLLPDIRFIPPFLPSSFFKGDGKVAFLRRIRGLYKSQKPPARGHARAAV